MPEIFTDILTKILSRTGLFKFAFSVVLAFVFLSVLFLANNKEIDLDIHSPIDYIALLVLFFAAYCIIEVVDWFRINIFSWYKNKKQIDEILFEYNNLPPAEMGLINKAIFNNSIVIPSDDIITLKALEVRGFGIYNHGRSFFGVSNITFNTAKFTLLKNNLLRNRTN
jgi:hypothetical protein